ncbi:Regulator of microtubule dynamics protein 2 [Halotydeus destructor]|nr:Regulator of microtubule dynamics protein 2 [Halotydeus destructor]
MADSCTFEDWVSKIDLESEDISVDRDQLYRVVKEGFDKFGGSGRADLQWRMARAAFKVAGAAEVAKDQVKRKEYLEEAEAHCNKALELDADNADAHLWLANVYGKICDFLGTKERIARGKDVQNHLEACVKIRPDEFNAYYTWGRWCMEVAKLTWLEKKIAAAIFDKVPEATYADAVDKFKMVNKLHPDWRASYYWLGKSLVNLKNYKEAFKAFDAAITMDIRDEEDQVVEADLQILHKKYTGYQ